MKSPAGRTFEHERGRVYAAHFALTHACWLVTYPAIGHAAAWFGTPRMFTWTGVACIVVTLAASRFRQGGPDHAHDRATMGT